MKIKHSWLNRTIVGFGLTSFFSDFCFEMTTPILPLFIEQLVGPGYGAFALGIIEGLSNGLASITRVLSGRLADTVAHYKPYLIAGYGIMPIFVGLIGTASSVWNVLFYKTIAWLFKAMREPIRDTWLSKIVTSKYYGRAFGFNRALDSAGAIVGPLLTYFIVNKVSFRTIFFIAIIPGIFSLFALLVFTREIKENERMRKSPQPWLKEIDQLPPDFKYFLWVVLLFGLGNFNQTLLIYRVQKQYMVMKSSSIIASGWVILFYVFFNIIRSLCEFSIGSLSDFVNRKKLLAIFGFGAFGLTSMCLIFEPTQVSLWFLLFGIAGLSSGTVKALKKAHAATLLPEDVRGTGFGILQAIDGVGDFISSALVGGLWNLFSPAIGFTYAACLSFCAMILLLAKK